VHACTVLTTQVERLEDELRNAESRHVRELEKLRRRMRQEKQDEIAAMMEQVDITLPLPPPPLLLLLIYEDFV
jgi:molecular chaperone GrpE (heat shock protein)